MSTPAPRTAAPTFDAPLILSLGSQTCVGCKKRMATAAYAEDLVYDGEVVRCPLCWGKAQCERRLALEAKAARYVANLRHDHPDAERDPVGALGQVAVDLKQALTLRDSLPVPEARAHAASQSDPAAKETPAP